MNFKSFRQFSPRSDVIDDVVVYPDAECAIVHNLKHVVVLVVVPKNVKAQRNIPIGRR